MGFFYISFLAIVQGITEFLPVSSSGHLLLISELLNQPDQTLQVDVAVHFGTLLAVVMFYRNDFKSLSRGLHKNMVFNFIDSEARFFRLLVLATLPVICAGFILKFTGFIHEMRSLKVIGIGMIVFGLILYLSERYGKKTRFNKDWTYKDAIIMGVWQAFALLPGTSRSGNTISGAMFLGFSRVSSVNLSLIMSIPTIFASSMLLLIDFITTDFENSNVQIIALCVLLSFLSAMIVLFLLVKFVRNNSFVPFVVYRLMLGSLILYLAYN